MQCPGCGFECQPDFAFCPKCGNRLGVPQAEPAPGLAERLQRLLPKEFTDQLLAAGDGVSHERRTITLLFCDVKGSTAMAETLDPEDVLEIMNGAFEVLIEPVLRYEGTLARLMGDAILAFFGAPTAHEDDPERACRAALDILEGAQAYAARLEAERGISGLNVRVGIHTGLVVVGEVGSDLRSEYTAMGDAVNLAARMEQAAEAGTVLISGATHKLVAPLFQTEALGPVAVKGKTEAVPVYRVLAAKEGVVKPRGIAGLVSPLVGRETECAALIEALARLQEGQGGVATIVGEAGIGKSRLIAELRSHAGAHSRAPLRWVEGRCLSYGASLTYQVWLDVLRAVLAVSHDDAPEDVDRALREQVQALCPAESDEIHPFLARLLSLPLDQETADRLDDLDGQSLQEGTFAAVETLISCAAQREPLVVVCEDLHWADPTSLQLLERLLPLTGQLPLLVLCVSRPVQEHRVWELLQTISRELGVRHTDLVLQPLSEDDGLTLVSNLLWIDELPEELKDRILGRAEGNPFYLEEILRSLIDQGAILQDEASGLWRAAGKVEEIHIPDTLAGVLVARIDRLQEETRRVLQLASVIGRVFLYRILAEISREERRLGRRLEALQREELIRERMRLPEVEYIFKHDLTREAAYNGLLKRDRAAFHQQVGEALEQLFPDRLEELLGLLAYHWEQAGVAAKAVDYLQRAGDQARLAYALEEAVDYYERALALLKREEELERAARTLMKLGLTHQNAFQFARARQAYEEGFALWQRAGRVPKAAVPPAPHALRLVAGNPVNLDPGRGTSKFIHQLFSGLVEPTPETDVVPDVAWRWETLDGGRRYVFYLRDDVCWSDGVPVTAGDFEYAWKRVLDPATDSLHAKVLYDIRGARAFHRGEASDPDTIGVRAAGDLTLVVDLEEPIAYLLQLLAYPGTFPVPRHVLEALSEAWAEPCNLVTNGPFRVQDWQPGASLALARNPEYHGQFTGNVERVEVSLLASGLGPELLAMYKADLLDYLLLWYLTNEEFDRVRQRYADDYVQLPFLATIYWGFNAIRQPFDDMRVRRAFAMAIDKESYYSKMDFAIPPATGGFLPPGMPGHSPGIALPYDPDQARQLLAEAGYPDGRGLPLIDCLLFPGDMATGFFDFLKSQWVESFGVEVQGEAIPYSQWSDRFRENPPHAHFTMWSPDYPDPDSFLRTEFSSKRAGWSNETYHRLVEEGRRTMDQSRRMVLYREADRILMEEAVIVPMEYGANAYLLKPWVTRFPSAVTNQLLFCKDVVVEPH